MREKKIMRSIDFLLKIVIESIVIENPENNPEIIFLSPPSPRFCYLRMIRHLSYRYREVR